MSPTMHRSAALLPILIWIGIVPLTAGTVAEAPAGPTPGAPADAPAPQERPPSAEAPKAARERFPESASAEALSDLEIARTELERGIARIASKAKPSSRLREAEQHFTAAIDRLAPHAEALDEDGHRVLARALEQRGRIALQRGRSAQAESDFEQAVRADPAYVPAAAGARDKALERFLKVRTAQVAFVSVKSDPPESEIVWNGRVLRPGPDPAVEVPVIAGPYTLAARAHCSEERTLQGSIEAGERRALAVRVEPLGRDLLFESEPAGLEVELDGAPAGRTDAPSGDPPPASSAEEGPTEAGASTGSAGGTGGRGRLLLACVPAGEHRWAIRGECVEETSGTATIVVDLLDRTPIVVPTIKPRRTETLLTVRTDAPGARLSLDGAAPIDLPAAKLHTCPGRKRLEVRTSHRLVWSEERDLGEGEVAIDAWRRPLLSARVIAEPDRSGLSREAVREVRERVQRLTSVNLLVEPDASGISSAAANGRGVDRKPAGTSGDPPDLLLTADAPDPAGQGRVRFRLHSKLGPLEEESTCALDDEGCFERFFDRLETPLPGDAPRTGLALGPQGEDTGVPVLTADAGARKGGVREGDSIVRVGATSVKSAEDLRRAAASALGATERATLSLILLREGATVEATLPVRRSPKVEPPGGSAIALPRLAAVADMDAALFPAGERRNAALLALASALMARGDYDRALDLALDRPGLADGVEGAAALGSIRYLAGICHDALGRREQAYASFRRAAADTSATLWEPDGLPVAPLARLALRGLGTP